LTEFLHLWQRVRTANTELGRLGYKLKRLTSGRTSFSASLWCWMLDVSMLTWTTTGSNMRSTTLPADWVHSCQYNHTSQTDICVLWNNVKTHCVQHVVRNKKLFHFLGKCPARMQDRYSNFGSHLLGLDALSKTEPLSLIRFVRTTKLGYCDLRLHRACTMGRTDTASALNS